MRQFKYLQRVSHEKFKITTDKGFIMKSHFLRTKRSRYEIIIDMKYAYLVRLFILVHFSGMSSHLLQTVMVAV